MGSASSLQKRRAPPKEDFTSDGVVLSTTPYGDRDIVARILTETHGKVSCFAASARTSAKKFPGGLEVFDTGRFTLGVSSGALRRLINFERTRSEGVALRENLDAMAIGCCVCECFDLLTHEDDQNANGPETFEVLNLALRAIKEGPAPRHLLKTCYVSLAVLAEMAGIFERGDQEPSSHALRRLLDAIQSFAGREIKSRSAVESVMKTLRPTST
jgi:DNA repair protein RecO